MRTIDGQPVNIAYARVNLDDASAASVINQLRVIHESGTDRKLSINRNAARTAAIIKVASFSRLDVDARLGAAIDSVLTDVEAVRLIVNEMTWRADR